MMRNKLLPSPALAAMDGLMAGGERTTSGGPRAEMPGARWMLIALTLLSIVSLLDRQLLPLVAEPLKKDLGITDFQTSLIMGPAFVLFFAVITAVMGWAVDSFPRRLVLYVGATIWALATIGCGLSTSFAMLFMLRAGVGVGEASLTPGGHSLLADAFPKSRLGTVFNLFTIGAALGGACGAVYAGFMLDAAAHRPLTGMAFIDGLHPWQLVFIGAGIPTLLAAFLCFSFREPLRAARPVNTGVGGGRELLRLIAKQPRVFLAVFVGFGFNIVLVHAYGAWLPTFVHRTFGWPFHTIGLAVAGLTLLAVTSGHTLTGLIVDYLYRRGVRDAHLRYQQTMMALSIPFAAIAFLTKSPWIFFPLIFVYYLLAYPCSANAVAAAQMFTPQHLRGRMSGIFMLVTSSIGLGLGPTVVGLLTTHVFRDPSKIGLSLFWVTIGAGVISLLLVGQGMGPMRAAPDTAPEEA